MLNPKDRNTRVLLGTLKRDCYYPVPARSKALCVCLTDLDRGPVMGQTRGAGCVAVNGVGLSSLTSACEFHEGLVLFEGLQTLQRARQEMSQALLAIPAPSAAQLGLDLACGSRRHKRTKECGRVPTKLGMRTQKFEFRAIFASLNTLLWIPSPSLHHLKT